MEECVTTLMVLVRTVCGCLVVGDGGLLVAVWCRFVMEVIMGESVFHRNIGVE